LNELEVGNVCKGRIERFEEKVEAVTSRLQRWKHELSENDYTLGLGGEAQGS
jgi:hypothetical protein